MTGAAGSFFHGWGLIGGSGSFLPTGLAEIRNAGGVVVDRRTAAVDTLAHELAHNLGLPRP